MSSWDCNASERAHAPPGTAIKGGGSPCRRTAFLSPVPASRVAVSGVGECMHERKWQLVLLPHREVGAQVLEAFELRDAVNGDTRALGLIFHAGCGRSGSGRILMADQSISRQCFVPAKSPARPA